MTKRELAEAIVASCRERNKKASMKELMKYSREILIAIYNYELERRLEK